MQRTFSIIKPDAVRKSYSAAILTEIEKAGFKIVAIKKKSITKSQAQGFYAVHCDRPFFDSLTTFMSSGPIVAMVLEKDNAIADLRKLMGATNPANAAEGTIRKQVRSLNRGKCDPRLRRRRHGSLRDRLLLRRLRADLGPFPGHVSACLPRKCLDMRPLAKQTCADGA